MTKKREPLVFLKDWLSQELSPSERNDPAFVSFFNIMADPLFEPYMRKIARRMENLKTEWRNFEETAELFVALPGEIPQVKGIDIYGECIPLKGKGGGDHITYVDFNQRFDLDRLVDEYRRNGLRNLEEKLSVTRRRGGIALLDVEGHSASDAFLAALFHQAFLLGIAYELRLFGEVTTNLFERINIRFYNSSAIWKSLTMIYGEISQEGTFRFLSAGHLPPKVFSYNYDRIVNISEDRLVSFPPIGSVPMKGQVEKFDLSLMGYKEKYTINEINLMGKGDILILYTDGLSELADQQGNLYFPEHLETVLRRVKTLSAKEIFGAIKEDLLSFGRRQDDLSFVIIKKE